ncbi:DUF2177 family protein [Alkalibacter mobilis]|uniref:DUF2177 family protein n=1 Tax=Alkalibacter mobilis TaxID=2787712 RepID=UPI00189DAF9E|nr:DUF2177 family protein [Alkalibacter mobilis]MBF7097394.1 DUF2177 family protein [Alkalibacter mobilis]
MQTLKMYVVTTIVFFAIDLLWLGLIAKNIYQKYLGYLMKQNVNWVAAVIFYLIFVGGIVFFVVNPAVEKKSFLYALTVGGFFGFIAYATYDLTNLATVKDWPVFITIVDLLWGTFLSGSTSAITYLIYTSFLNR